MVGPCRILFVLAAFLALSSTVLADDDPTDDLRVINISSGDVGALNRAVNDPANFATCEARVPRGTRRARSARGGGRALG